MKNKVTLLNVVTSVLLQFCTIISGFIVPRIILGYFGSDVNGLISSLNQFLSYISLLEGGLTSVIAANLYKPLKEKNNEKVSSIINTANQFYKKIGIIFILYSVVVAIIYPFIVNTGYSYLYVLLLTMILSINLFIQYMFSLSLKTLLTADKKVYIVSISQIFIIILNIILTIISVKIYPSVHFLKLISGSLYIIQPLIYNYYVKKYYSLSKNEQVDNSLIKNRWSGFAINIAAFIHFSTDITILTIFTDLKTVSIYSVYSLVTNGLRQLISSVSNGISPTIGHAYASNDFADLKQKFNVYEFVMFYLVFFLLVLAGLLITPFVMIYTSKIVDTNYYQPLFGILLILSESFYLLKFPHQNLAYSANKFKEITPSCFIEAFINIAVSLIFVNIFGLIGVAIGTCCGMLFRMIYQVGFSNKLLKANSNGSFYKKFFVFLLSSLITVFLCLFFAPIKNYSIMDWILHALIYSSVHFIILSVSCVLFFKNELVYLKKYLKK